MPIVAYQGRSVPLGEVYLIVAEHTTLDGHRVSEAFILHSRREPKIRAMNQRFAYGQMSPDPALVKEVDLVDSARHWALGEIEAHLLAWSEEEPKSRPIPASPTLEEKPIASVLQSLHLRRVLEAEVTWIKNHTEINEVRDAIRVARTLPRLAISSLEP